MIESMGVRTTAREGGVTDMIQSRTQAGRVKSRHLIHYTTPPSVQLVIVRGANGHFEMPLTPGKGPSSYLYSKGHTPP